MLLSASDTEHSIVSFTSSCFCLNSTSFLSMFLFKSLLFSTVFIQLLGKKEWELKKTRKLGEAVAFKKWLLRIVCGFVQLHIMRITSENCVIYADSQIIFFPFVIVDICCVFMSVLQVAPFLCVYNYKKKERVPTVWNSISFQVVDILNTNTDVAEVIHDYNMVRIRVLATF